MNRSKTKDTIEKKNFQIGSQLVTHMCVCELFVSMAEERLVGALKFKDV